MPVPDHVSVPALALVHPSDPFSYCNSAFAPSISILDVQLISKPTVAITFFGALQVMAEVASAAERLELRINAEIRVVAILLVGAIT
jgi:hypothetical protein